jgi:hypothetical protein
MLSGLLWLLATPGSSSAIENTEERERGIITDADRAYIRRSEAERKKNYTRTALYQRQKHIYNRTENAVLDIPILARHGDDELFRYLFASEVTDGRKKTADTARTHRAYSDMIVFLIRGILADEPDRPIETPEDLKAVLRPVIDEIETGIEEWLNRERARTAAFELTPSIETVQTIDGLVEELELRRSSLDAEERIENAKILDRAGYEDDEITALIGEEPDGDDEPGSDYQMEQLVQFPLETLTELVANGNITEDEHTEAIRRKAKTGDI